jgi:hypothetical protein
LEATAYVDPRTGYVTAKESAAMLADEAPVPVDLATKLPELAERWGTEIRFVSGEPERRLISEFDSMAGASRW